MELRKATIDDMDELGDLFNKYRIFYGKESALSEAKEFLSERFIEHESEIFIAISGAVITGFVQLYPLFSSTRMKRLWLLNDLFVLEEYRGKGISKALIERVKEFCRETGACGFTLQTAKTNIVGNRLYERMGLVLDMEYNTYSWDLDF
ncbi:MAG TPA: GNAT family N-acetyltransferase [Chryseolinea sp.]|nr:GNAT family N-acetyltransferase [Chryseolinea sp.]